MRFVSFCHTTSLPHHHFPNIFFHLWHHLQLFTTPSPPSPSSRWRKPWCESLMCCESFRLQTDSIQLVTHTCLLSQHPTHSVTLPFLLSLHLLLPLCPLLKANLVAAFEQSLALMTARLQTLSVSSEQKVSWFYHNVNESYNTCEIYDSYTK